MSATKRNRRNGPVAERLPDQPELKSSAEALRDLARAYRSACGRPRYAYRWERLYEKHQAALGSLESAELAERLDACIARQVDDWNRKPSRALDILRKCLDEDWELERELAAATGFKPRNFVRLWERADDAIARVRGADGELLALNSTKQLRDLLEEIRRVTWKAYGFVEEPAVPLVRGTPRDLPFKLRGSKRKRKKRARRVGSDQALLAVYLVATLVSDAGYDVFALSYSLGLGVADAPSQPPLAPPLTLRRLIFESGA
jgi:hypothetical protein